MLQNGCTGYSRRVLRFRLTSIMVVTASHAQISLACSGPCRPIIPNVHTTPAFVYVSLSLFRIAVNNGNALKRIKKK